MKKLLAIFLTLTLVLGMAAVPAFADENPTGSITINGVSEDNTYEIYQILDLASYNISSGTYSYEITDSRWADFFTAAAAENYVIITEGKFVTWNEEAKPADQNDNVATFAKNALAYAKSKGIDPVKSSETPGEFVITTDPETEITSGVFSGLDLGYYLIDSTMGALCGLTTTNPNASINAKNGAPTIDKQVKEDSTNQWRDFNTADIGQTVEFRVTVNVHAGAENYVLHDKMGDGFNFKSVSKIEHVVPGGNPEVTELGSEDYTVYTAPDSTITDECTFEVHFKETFCEGLETNDKLIIYYEAMLNRNAIVSGDGNTNTAWLTFGENDDPHETPDDPTVTKTFGIDIIKTDSQNTLINGAEFKIYDANTGGNEVGVVLMDDGVTYRRARADEMEAGLNVSIVVKDGKVRVVGLDNGTYYLEETKAPDGYNKLTARQKFIISDGNLDAIFNGDIYSSGSGVHVVNKTGSMLPETGGFGTTMFIILGGLAVMAAGIFLFVNKRMSQIAE